MLSCIWHCLCTLVARRAVFMAADCCELRRRLLTSLSAYNL